MKITRIYLKNLNSLRGEFTINLEQEPFLNAGIFAITGPTGAGKSTILDAITLALYGRAARYDTKPNPENMMSRGTGDCQAEVEFEVSKGKYRASWQMKRARGRPEGKLQPVSRYVYDDQDQTIAQNVSEANRVIEELTGLDADRFFRSVLLAQGDFVKFLKATPDDRANLLESLTGTEIYTEISKRAHEETAKRTNALKLREKDLANIHLLSPEEHAALKQQISEYKGAIESNTIQLNRLATLINQGNNLVKCLSQQKKLNEDLEIIQCEKKTLDTDFKRLKLFREASHFFVELQMLDQLRKNLKDKEKSAEHAKNNTQTTKFQFRTALDAAIEMLLARILEAEKSVLDLSTERNFKSQEFEALNAWLERNQLDQTLDANLSHLVEQFTSLMHQRQRLNELQQQQNILRKDLETAIQELKILQEGREEALTLLNEKRGSLDLAKSEQLNLLQGKTIDNIQDEIIKLEEYFNFFIQKQQLLQVLENYSQECEKLKNVIEDLTGKYTEAHQQSISEENSLRNIQEKIRLLKEKRDQNLFIASFQVHRENLAPGQACPLCGSCNHPFIDKEMITPKVSEIDKELNVLNESYLKTDSEQKRLISLTARIQENLRNTVALLELTSSKSESTKSLLNDLNQKYHSSLDKNYECILSNQNGKNEIQKKIAELRSMLKQAQEKELQKNAIQKAVDNATHALDLANGKIISKEEKKQSCVEQGALLQSNIDNTQNKMKEIEISLLNLLKHYAVTLPLWGEEKAALEMLEKRKVVYQENLKRFGILKIELGNFNLAGRELDLLIEKYKSQNDQLNQFILVYDLQDIDRNTQKTIDYSSLWNGMEDAIDSLERFKTDLLLAHNLYEECKKEYSRSETNYLDAEEKLAKELQFTQFETIEKLRCAYLHPNDVLRIQQSEERIKGLLDLCQGQLLQIQNELTTLLNDEVPQGDLLVEFQNHYNEINKQTNSIRGSLAVSENNLLQDEKNHNFHAKILMEIEAERKNLSIWQKLSHLIGSHDGKSFRKFAQGLSLDLLIRHANTHLSLLNDRYRLRRTGGEELDLEIQDLHQANVTRPTASLSGGESFLTSLALALGLSDLAGKNVKIDSLFIDEGFGSLDSESLEIAVQALESLRLKNKTIGVISHIELLKERISTQIVIEKGSGGVSRMTFSV